MLVDNVVAASSAANRKLLKRVGTAVDRREWEMAVTEVNAYYSPASNQIVIPAAILQADPRSDIVKHTRVEKRASSSLRRRQV